MIVADQPHNPQGKPCASGPDLWENPFIYLFLTGHRESYYLERRASGAGVTFGTISALESPRNYVLSRMELGT